MNYIKHIYIDKIEILDDIKKNNIFIEKLNLKLSTEDFNYFIEDDNRIKVFLKLLYELEGIKNIEYVKKNFYKKMSFYCVEDAIKNNKINPYRESLINKDLEQTLRYSEYLKKPMSYSEDIFFNQENLDTLYNENKDPFYYENVEHMYNFIMKILIPYYEKLDSTNYKKIILNKINDFIDIIVSTIEWKNIKEFLKVFFPDNITKNKRIISNIINSPSNHDFFKNFLLLEIKKEHSSNMNEIYNLFVKDGEKYNYIYKFLIKNVLNNSSYLLYLLSKFLNKRLPEEAEFIILSTENIAKDYIEIVKKNDKTVIIKTPGQIVNELINSKSGRPDSETEKIILHGSSSVLISYFKKVLKLNWEGNEDIRQKIEEKISTNVSDSIHYLFILLIDKLPKNKKNPSYINQYVLNYVSPKIIDSIINSNFPQSLFKFAELTRKKLPQNAEDVLKSYPYFWNQYQNLFI